MNSSDLPDYYSFLEVDPTASQEDIKTAYKRLALLNHPDRLPPTATAEERQETTRKFQLIADAYYILGDRSRRDSYDRSRSRQQRFKPFSATEPNASTEQANHLFGDIFEEILRPEVENPSQLWRTMGLSAGAILGFIVANLPGAAVGAMAGKTLGKIRDNKVLSRRWT
ncbi:DnaJ domain-containing protein [Pilobolus umbonatus]|nr:DnaJ domain-containing protein [Pilobolus umbonatus]